MTIKIDLEKSYDRLKQEFIRDTLQDIGMPKETIDLIQHFISSATMKVLQNGEALEEFASSRGIHQGDPLSPYLFVLCIQRLFHLIVVVLKQNEWRPIHLSRHGSLISHMAFANDIISFTKASIDQVHIIQNILNIFARAQGKRLVWRNLICSFPRISGLLKSNNLVMA